jgi:hypothetical protein
MRDPNVHQDNAEYQFQRDSLLDFFEPGEFVVVHHSIIAAGGLTELDIRFLNRLIAAYDLYGQADMPMDEDTAETFLELADRAMDIA